MEITAKGRSLRFFNLVKYETHRLSIKTDMRQTQSRHRRRTPYPKRWTRCMGRLRALWKSPELWKWVRWVATVIISLITSG